MGHDSWRPPALHLLSHLPVTSPQQNKTKTRKLNMKMYAKWAQPANAGHDETVKGRRKSSRIIFSTYTDIRPRKARFLIILSSGVAAERCPLGPEAGTWFGDVM